MRKISCCTILVLVILLCRPGFSRGEAALLKYPEFIDTALGNGLRVLIAEHHEQPAVFYRMLVKIGVRDEPTGKEGLAVLTASLLNQGTASRTAEEIAETIDGIGGRIWASSGGEYTTIGCDVLSEDLATGLDLFSSIILEPTFDRKDLQRVRKQLITEIKQNRVQPFTIASNHARYLLIGSGHRLGRVKTETSVKRIKAKDVKTFYQEHFLPNNSILLVIGDFSREEMLKHLSERFGGWSSGELKIREVVSCRLLDGIDFRFVNKPDLTQGNIAIRQWGIPSDSPDEPAYRIMNYILGGGGFSSRLLAVVRAEEGKTYGISSFPEQHPDFGILGIQTFTRNEEVVRTYESILSELKKFIDDGITEEELQKAKSYYLGAIPLGLESPQSIAGRILDGLYNGFTVEEMRRETVKLSNVTQEDVDRVAKKYLSSEAFVLVIVGNGKEIRKQLREIGKFKEVNYRARIVK